MDMLFLYTIECVTVCRPDLDKHVVLVGCKHSGGPSDGREEKFAGCVIISVIRGREQLSLCRFVHGFQGVIIRRVRSPALVVGNLLESAVIEIVGLTVDAGVSPVAGVVTASLKISAFPTVPTNA